MPENHALDPAVPWTELVVTDADWDAADPGLLTGMLSQLVLIRAFEEFVLELAGEGLIHGPAHSSIGQEGGAVGSVHALTSDDSVKGSRRGHHQLLAKALHHGEPLPLEYGDGLAGFRLIEVEPSFLAQLRDHRRAQIDRAVTLHIARFERT